MDLFQISVIQATDEVIKSYGRLKNQIVQNSPYFIADSERVVLKLLESNLRTESILATSEFYKRQDLYLKNFPQITFYIAQKKAIEAIVGVELHKGVMARALIPSDVELADFKDKPFFILDGVSKGDNVGAIVRNALAFGINHLLVGPDTCHPYQRRSVRVSMGNVFKLKAKQVDNLPEALLELQSFGAQIYALENRPYCENIRHIKFNKNSGFIIGSEGKGISQAVLSCVNQGLKIPISDSVFALNAACASAIVGYAFNSFIQSVEEVGSI